MNSWTTPSGGHVEHQIRCRLYRRSLLERGKSYPKVSLTDHQKVMWFIFTVGLSVLDFLSPVYSHRILLIS